MSTPEEPVRLVLESSGSSSELRRALGAARGDLPSPEQVEAMLARFPFPDGSGGGGDGGGGGAVEGATAAGAAKAGALTKWLAGSAFVIVSGGAALLATRSPSLDTPASPPVVAATSSSEPVLTASATAQPATTAVPALSAAPTHSTDAPRPRSSAVSSVSVTSSAVAAPPRPETEILKEAHAARSNPARMLALVDEHARSWPSGMLGQEREMLRIEALVGLGRKSEAKALADAFRKANPNSAYTRRLDALVPP